MKIKVCGMRDGKNIREVEALGVDYIGMIFWDGSPRNVTMVPTHAGIIPDRASLSTHTSNLSPKKVGVFVDEMPQSIITRVVNFQLDVVQMHGHESPTVIRNLRATLDPDIRPSIQFWKAVSIANADDLTTLTLEVTYGQSEARAMLDYINKFRAGNDDMSSYFVITCNELPTTVGQEVRGEIKWTSGSSVKTASGLVFKVEKYEDTGLVWLWCAADKTGAVVKILN